jgi:hypothetical protein
MNKNKIYILGYLTVLSVSIFLMYTIKKKRDAEIDAKVSTLDEAIERYNVLTGN